MTRSLIGRPPQLFSAISMYSCTTFSMEKCSTSLDFSHFAVSSDTRTRPPTWLFLDMLSATSCRDSMVSVPPVFTSMRSAVAVAPRRVVSPSALSEMFWPMSVVFCQVVLSNLGLTLQPRAGPVLHLALQVAEGQRLRGQFAVAGVGAGNPMKHQNA